MATRVQSAPGNRWAIACAGVVVMIIAGTAYAWSNFTQPLVAAFGWSSTQASLIFGLAIFFIGVGAVVGGRWQDRIGPRTVTITGIVLWGIGNLLAAVGPTRRRGFTSPTVSSAVSATGWPISHLLPQ